MGHGGGYIKRGGGRGCDTHLGMGNIMVGRGHYYGTGNIQGEWEGVGGLIYRICLHHKLFRHMNGRIIRLRLLESSSIYPGCCIVISFEQHLWFMH